MDPQVLQRDRRVRHPLGTAYTYAQVGDTLVVGHGRTAEIRRYDPAGRLLSLFRWAERPRPVTREDRRRYEKLRLESLARMPDHPESRFWYPALDEFPELPTHKPIFDRIVLDDEGGIWLRAFPPESFGDIDGRFRVPAPTNRRWTVIAADGTWLGEVTLPDRFDLYTVARGRIYGVVKDSLDVQTVQVFRIRKPAGMAMGVEVGTGGSARNGVGGSPAGAWSLMRGRS